MIHRQTFKDINQQVIDQPEHIPELILNLLSLNQSEIPTVINFSTASTDAMNNLWWLQRLANRKSLADDDISTESIIAHLNHLQSEYWFQLQNMCRNSGFLSLEAFDQVLNTHHQEITQKNVDDPNGLQPFQSFWNQYGGAISAIMDNDDQYRYLDQIFKTSPIDATLDINQLMIAFNTLKFRYVAKVMYLNNVYGNYKEPRINFGNYRQRLEFVHDEFKQTLKSFFNLAGRIVDDLINEANGSDSTQVTNVEALIDISHGLIPIDSNDAHSFATLLLGFDNMHKEFLYHQIKRLEQGSFLEVNDFNVVFDYWESCQTTEERSNLTVFHDFFQQHRDQLVFLDADFAAFKFVDNFFANHANDYQQVRIADALELHDNFLSMRNLYLATVDVIRNL